MGKLGFALGTLAGITIATANAKEIRAYELNEIGISLANQHQFNDALTYLLEANELMPNNEVIQNNITICRGALNRNNAISKRNKEIYELYKKLDEIPEDSLMIFLKERHMNFNSKNDCLVNIKSRPKYQIKKFIEDYNNYINKKRKEEQTKIKQEQRKIRQNQRKIEEQNKLQYICQSKENFQNYIIDNMDELCRIYSIPKISKSYVVNYIMDNYSEHQVIEDVIKYIE